MVSERKKKKRERLHKICQFQPEKPFNKILNAETLVGWRSVWSSDSNIKDVAGVMMMFFSIHTLYWRIFIPEI